MTNKLLGILIIVLLFVVALSFAVRVSIMDSGDTDDDSNTATSSMRITSNAFENEQAIPAKFTCDGDNINPALAFSEVPNETVSIALIADDPDAPTGTWVHWVLWNISADTEQIGEDSVPEGAVEGMTSFGQPGYGGPCPPDGEHRYYFKAYALDTELELEPGSGKEELEEAMVGHVLDKAELMGVYERTE